MQTAMASKEVLLLTQVLPYPPDSGPKVKTYNVLKYLTQRHRVTVLSFMREADSPESVRHLQAMCKAVYTVPMSRSYMRELGYLAQSVLTHQPWVMVRDDRPSMREMVDKLAHEQHFDVVHADQLNMAQFALRVPGAYKVLDLHNALWVLNQRLSATLPPGPQKILSGRDWHLLQHYEGDMCRHFDTVLAVSEIDKRALIEVGAHDDIVVIPIAIDTDEAHVIERAPTGPNVIHIGSMSWPPNADGILWFLHEVYPKIKAAVPNVRCNLIGTHPPQETVHVAQTDPSVAVTGYVADPEPYLRESSVMVVPLRAGGGVRVKIINALAQGIPIVSTSVGCEGIEVTDGKDVLIADTPTAFADAVVRLLNDPDLATRLAQNGRTLVETRYDYRVACQRLDEVYARA